MSRVFHKPVILVSTTELAVKHPAQCCIFLSSTCCFNYPKQLTSSQRPHWMNKAKLTEPIVLYHDVLSWYNYNFKSIKKCFRNLIKNHGMCFCIQIRVARLEQLEKELHDAQSSRGAQEKNALPETQVTHTHFFHHIMPNIIMPHLSFITSGVGKFTVTILQSFDLSSL